MEKPDPPVASVPSSAVATAPPSGLKKTLTPLQFFLSLAMFCLICAAGISYMYFSVKTPALSPTAVIQLPKPSPAPVSPQLFLDIAGPQDMSVVDSGQLVVTGNTAPDTPVAMYTDTSDAAVISDSAGKFTAALTLTGGLNTLIVTAMGSDGRETTLTRVIAYNSQVLGATTDTSKFRHTNPVIGGEISSFSSDNIQVRENPGQQMKNLKVDKRTIFVDEKNKPIKSSLIKAEHEAIIIASDSAALKVFFASATDSARLLMSKRRAVQGVVTAVNGLTVTLTHPTRAGRQFTVLTDTHTIFTFKNTAISLAEITVGSRLIAVGDTTGPDSVLARRILLIPGNASGLFVNHPLATPSAVPETFLTSTPAPVASPSATPTVSP